MSQPPSATYQLAKNAADQNKDLDDKIQEELESFSNSSVSSIEDSFSSVMDDSETAKGTKVDKTKTKTVTVTPGTSAGESTEPRGNKRKPSEEAVGQPAFKAPEPKRRGNAPVPGESAILVRCYLKNVKDGVLVPRDFNDAAAVRDFRVSTKLIKHPELALDEVPQYWRQHGWKCGVLTAKDAKSAVSIKDEINNFDKKLMAIVDSEFKGWHQAEFEVGSGFYAAKNSYEASTYIMNNLVAVNGWSLKGVGSGWRLLDFWKPRNPSKPATVYIMVDDEKRALIEQTDGKIKTSGGMCSQIKFGDRSDILTGANKAELGGASDLTAEEILAKEDVTTYSQYFTEEDLKKVQQEADKVKDDDTESVLALPQPARIPWKKAKAKIKVIEAKKVSELKALTEARQKRTTAKTDREIALKEGNKEKAAETEDYIENLDAEVKRLETSFAGLSDRLAELYSIKKLQ